VRGANINYVNSNGLTALHNFVENKLHDAIKFLLYKGADPHIMDLTGEDCCDKAKRLEIDHMYKEFQECSLRKKVIPMLPNGKHPDYKNLPYFKYQKE
jgi:ankyrin repeat protein